MQILIKKILLKFVKPPSNSIVVICNGGLGNRLPALSSALELSNQLNKKIIVYWLQNTGLYAKFESLFEINKPHQMTIINWNFNRHDKIKPKLLSIAMRKFYEKKYQLHISSFDKLINSFTPMDNIDTLRQYDSIVIRTWKPIIKTQLDNLSYLRPIKSIQKNIDCIKKHLNKKHLVGIHIRRGDRINLTKQNSIQMFIKYMQQEIDVDDQVQFFVASDSKAEKEKLKKEFGKRIISCDGHYSRTDEIGMQNAVVDLYLLAEAKKIIGSFGSTYSKQAVLLKGVRLYRIRNNNLIEFDCANRHLPPPSKKP